jgi:uncharacterized protein YehS (DUF1456 family)
MARYIIQNDETKAIKKSLKKWGEIRVSNEQLNGIVKIKNYRKYNGCEEVDVVFEGIIFVRMGREKRAWHTNKILTTHNISKIKLNRFLRKSSLFEIKTMMKYFGVEIDYYYNIGKIKWE